MPYRLAVTGADVAPDGTTTFGDIGLDRLPGVEWRALPAEKRRVDAEDVGDCDAVLILGAERFDAASIPQGGRLRHVARFGAGFDSVDTVACEAAGITVTNTPDAVRRPVAEAALTLILALAHNLRIKDGLVRSGRWNERARWRGRGVTGRTVGIVGFGGIGQETARLAGALGIDVVAWNRTPRPDDAERLGVRMLPLDELLAVSDYVVVAVAANDGTRHLIGERELSLLRPTSFLVNVARGSVIDEEALVEALGAGRIAGAGLDVFAEEPLPADHPLTELDGVILAPHSLCWTDEFTDAVSASVREAVLDVREGRAPRHAVTAP
ncbi:MAG: NAD(P)-dependent oxidoreductase [Microbacterium sp.]